MKIFKILEKQIHKLKYPNLYNFKKSSEYWNERYHSGGDSGPGSYGRLAEFKAEFLNKFIEENQINSMIELGCGDGNQLKLFKVRNYIGVDVVESVVVKNRNNFKDDKSRQFLQYNLMGDIKSDLIISFDVIFHLIEDVVFEEYMKVLFDASDRYVIIYSSNSRDLNNIKSPHVKHRRFTDWVNDNAPQFTLIKRVLNKFPWNDNKDTSFCDFYVFEK